MPEPHYTSGRTRLSTVGIGILVAAFALVFSLRLWLIREWGSAIPFWDQWDSEAWTLFRPWLDGSLGWRDLLVAVNEHRIVLTRLLDLGLLTLAGYWATWWQLVANAALNAITPIVLIRCFWGMIAPRYRLLFVLTVAALFATPSSWQNALWGIQSICYFINALTAIAVCFLFTTKPLHGRWWLGWSAALLALFAQGSGVFTSAAVVAVMLFSLLLDRPLKQEIWWTLGSLILVVALGVVLRVDVPKHAYLRAHDASEFFAVCLRCLAWPHIAQPLLCVVLQAPMGWLLVELIRHRRAPTPLESCALALGLISLLNAAAVAYSRGGGLVDYQPISRYHDSFLPGTVANLCLVLGPISRLRHGRIIALGWVGQLLLGLALLAAGSLTFNLPFKAQQNHIAATMVSAYLETRDPAVFETQPPFLRPHPSPQSVVRVLDDPVLAPILPPELRGGVSSRPWPVEYASWLALATAIVLVGLLAYDRRLSQRLEDRSAP
jgi:hypothetical protein